ncbi:MAG: hypothetical protein E4G99_09495 [Anaerolineales bacterium]|nr:MAG: hypothetical protein E4G99_09495 [Anaerolineales bacterium]
MTESIVYQSAARHIRHTGCPIPSAILKAIEVEVGIALPHDVVINFINSSHDTTNDLSSGGE